MPDILADIIAFPSIRKPEIGVLEIMTRKLNVITVIKRDIWQKIVGLKEEAKKGKAQGIEIEEDLRVVKTDPTNPQKPMILTLGYLM